MYDEDGPLKGNDFLGSAILPSEVIQRCSVGRDIDLTLRDDRAHAGELVVRVILPDMGLDAGQSDGARISRPPCTQTPSKVSQPWQSPERVPQICAPQRAPLGEAKRLTVSLVSVSGLQVDARSIASVCEVARSQSRFETRGASGGKSVVWNEEREMEYVEGQALEFHLVERGPAGEVVLGSCNMSAVQFEKFGYAGELTVSSPSNGIQGLLKVKVTVGPARSVVHESFVPQCAAAARLGPISACHNSWTGGVRLGSVARFAHHSCQSSVGYHDIAALRHVPDAVLYK